MLNLIHARLGGEDGISLVEMVVAMFVVAFAVTAMASTAITSLVALSSNERQVRATALANEVVENLQAMPWDKVGFYSGDFASTPPAGTVLLPGTRSATTAPCLQTVPPLPTCTGVLRDGIAYDVAVGLTWVDDAVDGVGTSDQDSDVEDYKHVTVDLSWQNRGVTKQLHVEGRQAPNADDKGFLEILTLEPKGVLLDSNFKNVTQVDIIAFTRRPALNNVSAKFKDRNGTEVTQLLTDGGGGTKWTGQIAAGSQAFANGETVFTVTATAADDGEIGTVTDRVVFYQPLEITPPVLSQSPINVLGATGQLCSPLTLTVDVKGVTSADSVVASWENGPAEQSLVFVEHTIEGARFRRVYSTAAFTSTQTRLSVNVQRGFDAATGSASFDYSVKRKNIC